MALDWRIQASTTTVTDIPEVYPGGPTHLAGSTVVVVSQVQPTEGAAIVFPAPSASSLALSTAARAAKTAEVLKGDLHFKTGAGLEGYVQLLDGSASPLFDYFEQCFVAVVFSLQALEAYCNYKIALTLKGTLTMKRRGKELELSPDEVERQLSTDEKLGVVLPELLGVASPKGRSEWEDYVHLRELRDATVHIKSHHQWTSASRDFDGSPYSWFIQQSPSEIPLPAIGILRCFAVEHERQWLQRTKEILGA